jgi:hypothetical protein
MGWEEEEEELEDEEEDEAEADGATAVAGIAAARATGTGICMEEPKTGGTLGAPSEWGETGSTGCSNRGSLNR